MRLCDDLSKMGIKAYFCPARDIELRPIAGRSHEYERSRIEILSRIIKEEFDVAVVCADGASQLTIPPEELQERMLTISAGSEVSVDDCVSALSAAGYERCEMVEGAGQFSLRGGILDFFPPDAPHPVRADFWGDEIDTLQFFDIDTQRSIEPVEEIHLLPAAELIITDYTALAAKVRALAKSLRGKAAAAAKGRPLVNLLPLSENETITAILPVPEDDVAAIKDSGKEHFLMFVTASGTVRRNRMADFDSIRANGKIAMKLDDGDSLVSVLPCTEDQDVFLATYRGRCIRFPVPEASLRSCRISVLPNSHFA